MTEERLTDSRANDSGRINLSPPETLRAAVLAMYPESDYPTLRSEGDCWKRLAEEALAHQPPRPPTSVVVGDSSVAVVSGGGVEIDSRDSLCELLSELEARGVEKGELLDAVDSVLD